MDSTTIGSLVLILVTSFSLHTIAQEDIRIPPMITKSPDREVVYKQATAVDLDCSATGIPEPTYAWYKDDKLLEIRDKISQNPPGSGNIVIDEANTYQDDGEYECRATNKYGVAKSGKIRVRQAKTKYARGNDPVTKTVALGDSLVLEPFGEIVSYPAATFSWKTVTDADTNADQRIIVTTPRIALNSANGKLYFAHITKDDVDDGRIFKLDVYNPIEDITSGGSPTIIEAIDIDARVSNKEPTLMTPSSNDYTVTALKGKNITMKCFYAGYPTPRVSWILPSNPPPQARIDCTQQHSTECLIKNLEYSDAGTYRCQGDNPVGKSEAKFRLVVESMPSFSKRPQSVNATVGSKAVFHCDPDASPDAQIEWFSNNDIIDPADPGSSKLVISRDRKTLTVQDICKNCDGPDPFDLQVFQCHISNKHGSAYASAYLNVIDPTEIYYTNEQEVELDLETATTMEANFTCKAKADPLTKDQLELAWWLRNARIYSGHGGYTLGNGDTTLHINLTGLTADEISEYVGEYKCLAYTDYSNDTAIFKLSVKGIVPVAESSSFADWWWIILLILLILLLILLCLCCCYCLRRNRGDEYPVDEKEKQNGNNPEAELRDMDFHEHHRRDGTQEEWKGSKASLLGSQHSLHRI